MSIDLQTRYIFRRPLLPIWLAPKSFVIKRSSNLSFLLLAKLKYQLRLLNPNSRSQGFDKHFDKVVHLTALRMLNPEVFDIENHLFLFQGDTNSLISQCLDAKQEYEKNKNEIDQLVDAALKNPRIKDTVIKCFIVKNFTEIQKKDERASEYYQALAKRYDQDISRINVEHLSEIDGETRKEIKDLKNQITDREAFKISLSLANAGALVSIVSTLFLITGYLYNNFLLGHFGIKVSEYFSLSDYLASSIEGVRYAALAAAVALISFFIGMHMGSRRSYAQMETDKKQTDYSLLLIFIVWTALSVKLYLDDSEKFYPMAYSVIILIAFTLAPRISRHYFKEPNIAIFAIVFIASFSAHISESVETQIYRIEHNNIEDMKRYDISFKNPVPFDSSNITLIAANNSYLFLRDNKRKIYIVPKEQIQYVLVNERKPNKELQPTP